MRFFLAHHRKGRIPVFFLPSSSFFLLRAAITAPGPEATRREPIGFREKSQSSGEQIMRRIQGEAKSHAGSLSFKCDPGDHTRSSTGRACMCCRTGTALREARLKTHACAHDAAESRARRGTTRLSAGGNNSEKTCTVKCQFEMR